MSSSPAPQPAAHELSRLAAIDLRSHAVFLDFDGTLAPIVPRPEDAAMAPRTAAALSRLSTASGGALALISGRGLADLDQRVAPLVLPAAGSHGAEWRLTAGGEINVQARDAALERALAEVRDRVRPHDLKVEEKAGAVTLHYRGSPDLAEMCRDLMETIAAAEPSLRAFHGHMVSEIALIGIDKGRILRHFVTEAPFAGRPPFMAGDDTTDEDAIAAAQSLGGTGVRIGSGESCAAIRLPDIETFLDWLCGDELLGDPMT